MNQDKEHLDLLAVFHYVVAGITALMACIPLLHLAVGIAFLLAPATGPDPPPRFLGWFFIFFAGFFILCGWTLALFMFLTGRCLHRRRAWKFCLVVGAIECIVMPFGTVLGVFTIVVLSRQSVKELFGLEPAAPL